VACVGKFVGPPSRPGPKGLAPREASAIGVLMNTRGLTELVILNVGLAKGVLDPSLFTLLVVMAIVTTVITEPALRFVYPDKLLQRDIGRRNARPSEKRPRTGCWSWSTTRGRATRWPTSPPSSPGARPRRPWC